MRGAAFFLLFLSIAMAGDGIKPRAQASDYPASGNTQHATIAAAVLAPDRIKKTFGADVGRKYVVVEVAIYPQAAMDVDAADFHLKGADGALRRPDSARRAASAWDDSSAIYPNPPVTATAAGGVDYETGSDPAGGQREHGVGTYTGVSVSNDPRAAAPAPPRNPAPSPYGIEAKLNAFALPEGRTHDPVAGYLYFPKPSKKSKQVSLLYERDGASIELALPMK